MPNCRGWTPKCGLLISKLIALKSFFCFLFTLIFFGEKGYEEVMDHVVSDAISNGLLKRFFIEKGKRKKYHTVLPKSLSNVSKIEYYTV